jgi:hypothetical protein
MLPAGTGGPGARGGGECGQADAGGARLDERCLRPRERRPGGDHVVDDQDVPPTCPGKPHERRGPEPIGPGPACLGLPAGAQEESGVATADSPGDRPSEQCCVVSASLGPSSGRSRRMRDDLDHVEVDVHAEASGKDVCEEADAREGPVVLQPDDEFTSHVLERHCGEDVTCDDRRCGDERCGARSTTPEATLTASGAAMPEQADEGIHDPLWVLRTASSGSNRAGENRQ